MRIALVASVGVTVPPQAPGGAPGGAESVIAELAKMLTRLGHAVVVYASGDSHPGCALNWRIPSATSHASAQRELRHLAYAWGDIATRSQPFDIVHAHHPEALAVRGDSHVPTVFTVHHDRDEALFEHYSEFPDVCYVATSDAQVSRMPELQFRAVVRSGLDPDDYQSSDTTGDYCAFIGTLGAEDAPHLAIDAARLAGVPLKLAAEEHTAQPAYFAEEILPRLDAAGGAVRWLGNLSAGERLVLQQKARALLVPSGCEEPLSAIEAMLSGTPVIAFARGNALDVVDDGVTGFLVRDAAELAKRLREVGALDRARCRRRAIERWSSVRMATEYEGLYEALLRAQRKGKDSARVRVPAVAAALAKQRFSGLFSPLWEA